MWRQWERKTWDWWVGRWEGGRDGWRDRCREGGIDGGREGRREGGGRVGGREGGRERGRVGGIDGGREEVKTITCIRVGGHLPQWSDPHWFITRDTSEAKWPEEEPMSSLGNTRPR